MTNTITTTDANYLNFTEDALEQTLYVRERNQLITHIDGEDVVVECNDVWMETFLKWDRLVPSDVAVRIACQVNRILFNFSQAAEQHYTEARNRHPRGDRKY